MLLLKNMVKVRDSVFNRNKLTMLIFYGYNEGKVKIVPPMIEVYLTPLALAVWVMDDGGAVSSGLKIGTNNFTLLEVKLLCNIINRKYGLNARPHSSGVNNQYVIYIPSTSMGVLAKIIGPHMHPSMYYKLNSYL